MSLDRVARATAFVDLAGLLRTCEVDGCGVDFTSWGFFERSVWRNHAHTHSFHEVCLAFAGAGTFVVEGRAHAVEAGTVFIARPGEVHEIIADPDDGLGIAFWGFALADAPDPEPGWWHGLARTDRPLVSSALGALPELVSMLAAEASSPRSGITELTRALGAALVVETARAFSAEEDLEVELDPAARTTSTVAAMERYLADNLDRGLQVADVAAAVHLSTRQASRLFAQETGTSVMTALRRLRLEHGARLLLETDAPVTQVARASGYREVRAFITAFRRRYGQPPGSFRARAGTLHL